MTGLRLGESGRQKLDRKVATITFHVGPASLSGNDLERFLLVYDTIACEVEKKEHKEPSTIEVYI